MGHAKIRPPPPRRVLRGAGGPPCGRRNRASDTTRLRDARRPAPAALLSVFLGIAEGSSRSGSDRLARFRCARGEASEAAAALEAVQLLRLAPNNEIDSALALLDRLCAMLTRLDGPTHRPADK